MDSSSHAFKAFYIGSRKQRLTDHSRLFSSDSAVISLNFKYIRFFMCQRSALVCFNVLNSIVYLENLFIYYRFLFFWTVNVNV